MNKETPDSSVASQQWLELRSGVPGQGSFLVEHRRAYQVFDRPEPRPQMILAVGGKEKREFLERGLGSTSHPPECGIALVPISSIIVVDCEMHGAAALKRIRARPPAGDQTQHRLLLADNSRRHQIAQFAKDLYWQTLAPFTSSILLFCEDLGGLIPVTRLLATWIRRSMLDPIQCPPRILIIHQEDADPDMAWFESRLLAKLKAMLQVLDPLTPATDSRAATEYRAAFDKVQFLPINTPAGLLSQLDEAFDVRAGHGFAFHSRHLRNLLQEAVSQIGRGMSRTFDFFHASRLHNPVPADLGDRIADFVHASRISGADQAAMIASALNFNAHPPGMHCEYAYSIGGEEV